MITLTFWFQTSESTKLFPQPQVPTGALSVRSYGGQAGRGNASETEGSAQTRLKERTLDWAIQREMAALCGRPPFCSFQYTVSYKGDIPPPLLGDDCSEVAIFVVGTGGEEEVVRLTIADCSPTKLNAPQTGDRDHLPRGGLECTQCLASRQIEGVDGTGRRIVRYQQRIAESSEIAGSYCQTPRLVKRSTVREVLHKCSIFAEDVNVTPRSARRTGKGHIELSVDILDAEGRESRLDCAVGQRPYQAEVAVVDINFVVGRVGAIQRVTRCFTGKWQPGIDRT